MPDSTQRRFRRVVVAGIALALVAFAALWYSVVYRGDRAEQAKQAAIEACLANDRTINAVEDVFILLRQLAQESEEPRSPAEQERVARFFADAIDRLEDARCDPEAFAEGEMP